MSFPFDPVLIEEAAREQMHGRILDALALSQAISLKRIADAFDSSDDGGRVQGSVLYWLEIIASAANAGKS